MAVGNLAFSVVLARHDFGSLPGAWVGVLSVSYRERSIETWAVFCYPCVIPTREAKLQFQFWVPSEAWAKASSCMFLDFCSLHLALSLSLCLYRSRFLCKQHYIERCELNNPVQFLNRHPYPKIRNFVGTQYFEALLPEQISSGAPSQRAQDGLVKEYTPNHTRDPQHDLRYIP